MPIILMLLAFILLSGCESKAEKAEKAEKQMIDEMVVKKNIPLNSNPIKDPFE